MQDVSGVIISWYINSVYRATTGSYIRIVKVKSEARHHLYLKHFLRDNQSLFVLFSHLDERKGINFNS